MRIEWTGDLSDDCSASVGDITAHCESMGTVRVFGIDDDGKTDRREKFDADYWFVGVYRGEEVLYHSGEAGGMILDGDCARAIAGAVMKAATKAKGERDE